MSHTLRAHNTHLQVTNNAVRIMQFAKAMLRESQPVLMPHNSEPVQLRIGIHTGPLVSGLVGAKVRARSCMNACFFELEKCLIFVLKCSHAASCRYSVLLAVCAASPCLAIVPYTALPCLFTFH